MSDHECKCTGISPGKCEGCRRAERDTADIVAAGDFRQALIRNGRVDAHHRGFPLWHGWVIVEAYLAGVRAERERCAQLARDWASGASILNDLEGRPMDPTKDGETAGDWIADAILAPPKNPAPAEKPGTPKGSG
jgi:hypothetical protein